MTKPLSTLSAPSSRRLTRTGPAACLALAALLLLSCGCTTAPQKPAATTVPTASWVISTPLETLPPQPDPYAISPYPVTTGGNTADGVLWDYYHAMDTGSYATSFEFASIPHGQTAREREKARSGFAGVYSDSYGLRGEYITFSDLTVHARTPVVPCKIHDPFILEFCKKQSLSEAWEYSFTLHETSTNPRERYDRVSTNRGFSVLYNGTWYFLERNPVT